MQDILERAVFVFTGRAAECATLNGLNGDFRAFIEPFGFQNWSATWLRAESAIYRPPAINALGEPPGKWRERYRDQHYAADDPAVHAILAGAFPVLTRETREGGAQTQRARQLRREAEEFGVADGVLSPVRLADGHVWGVELYGEAQARDPIALSGFLLASHLYVHRALSLSARDSRTRGAVFKLTPRMREILGRMRNGETQTSIARALGVSRRTVEHLTHDARERLGVRTTAALLVEAARRGEIHA